MLSVPHMFHDPIVHSALRNCSSSWGAMPPSSWSQLPNAALPFICVTSSLGTFVRGSSYTIVLYTLKSLSHKGVVILTHPLPMLQVATKSHSATHSDPGLFCAISTLSRHLANTRHIGQTRFGSFGCRNHTTTSSP